MTGCLAVSSFNPAQTPVVRGDREAVWLVAGVAGAVWLVAGVAGSASATARHRPRVRTVPAAAVRGAASNFNLHSSATAFPARGAAVRVFA